LDGHSGVWLLLLSSDQAKDDAAAKLLAEEVDRANKTLRLPDMTGDRALEGPDSPNVSNLRVEFSVIEMRRSDPAEDILVRMLIGSEPDLVDYQEPMAFPVYGRGRILYALVGQGITAANVMNANAFLVGECACEIKAENPGIDLLLPVEWKKSIGDTTAFREVILPPLPGTALPASGKSHATMKQEPSATEAIGASPVLRNAAFAVAAVVILVAAGTILRFVRRHRAA